MRARSRCGIWTRRGLSGQIIDVLVFVGAQHIVVVLIVLVYISFQVQAKSARSTRTDKLVWCTSMIIASHFTPYLPISLRLPSRRAISVVPQPTVGRHCCILGHTHRQTLVVVGRDYHCCCFWKARAGRRRRRRPSIAHQKGRQRRPT